MNFTPDVSAATRYLTVNFVAEALASAQDRQHTIDGKQRTQAR